MKKNKSVEYFTNDTDSKPITKKEFLRLQKEEAIADCVLQSVLLKNKSFTLPQINKLVSAKMLSRIKYKSEIYFKKDEISKSIKYISEPSNLFTLSGK